MSTKPKRPPAAERLITVADVCAELQVARSTFYRWLSTGRGPKSVKLPNGKVRIRRSDLDAWLAKFDGTAA